jgi:hypothetical protein
MSGCTSLKRMFPRGEGGNRIRGSHQKSLAIPLTSQSL